MLLNLVSVPRRFLEYKYRKILEMLFKLRKLRAIIFWGAGTTAFLDAAQERNISVLLSLKDFYPARAPAGVDAEATWRAVVAQHKHHPALLGWYASRLCSQLGWHDLNSVVSGTSRWHDFNCASHTCVSLTCVSLPPAGTRHYTTHCYIVLLFFNGTNQFCLEKFF